MSIHINYADMQYLEYLAAHDTHVGKAMLEKKIRQKEIIIARMGDVCIGWLRFGYFWDAIPFMNMLFLDEDYRGKGHGAKLVAFWEKEMKAAGHAIVMTSTLSSEQAQFFYRKLGYTDSGCLLLENEALEIVFSKGI